MEQTFGRVLRHLRSARALTQERLGPLVHVTGGYISDLELGRRRPHPELAVALDQLLAADGALVALAAAEHAAAQSRLPDWADTRLAAGMTGDVRPDATMRDYLTQSLALQRTAEDTAGAKLILTPTLGQFTAVETLRDAAGGQLHRDLLSLESQYAQFVGWLYQDLGDRAASEQWYARALMLAHEAGDNNMIASILSMRSNSAWGVGNIRRAVDLGEAATRPRATPGVLALSHQQAARGYAAAGDRTAALRALDEAARLVDQAIAAPDREPPWVYFAGAGRLDMQRAIALRELGDHRRAVDLFRAALDLLPDEFRRDRGTYLARLALALALAGERDEAAARVVEARGLAVETGSARTLREIARAEEQIAA